MRESEESAIERGIVHWRSTVIGIAAEPLKASLPELDAAMNHLMRHAEIKMLRAMNIERQSCALYQQGLEKRIDELVEENARLTLAIEAATGGKDHD